jgi:glycolate oxidase FAD binding subunit
VARLTPASIEEAQALLAEGGRSVLFVGGGTAMPPGPATDVEISTSRLNQIVEYAPADQVVVVESGVTVAQLQGELTKNGQRLAIDPPQPEKATIGGIVAANSFGPLRTRYGTVRDLIIGVSVVRADGTRAKGGGKVVKNVAGFDLPKLMCGSYGTLAFIATATFRVHPLPEQILSLRARGADPVELVRRVRAQQLEPAVMLAIGEGGGWDVYFRFEGFGAGVRAQREKLRELEECEWPARASGAVRIRFAALPTQAAEVAKALAPLRARIEWLPTLGVGWGSCDAVDPVALQGARRALMALGGWLVAPGDWGPPPGSAAEVNRSVKKQFDPANVLAPGRFIV